VAQATLDEVGDALDLWLMPPLAYTKSNEHSWAPGTMWLSPGTMLSILDELAGSLAATACRRLVVFNGHGGNSALVAVALREIRLKHGLMTFLAHPILPPDSGGADEIGDGGIDELAMGIHAGADETSLMLFLEPASVDMSVAVRSIPEHLADNAYVRFGGRVGFGWLSDDFGPDGVIGDPTGASPERGEVLFTQAVAHFAAALGEIAAFDLP
jgi:creatinine amidohydrolase